MRALPTMGVFQPMDARETELLMEYPGQGVERPGLRAPHPPESARPLPGGRSLQAR